MNTATKKHVPSKSEGEVERNQIYLVGDLVVLNEYQDRAKEWYKWKQEKGVRANSTKNGGTMMEGNGSTKWL
ncbi:unnamed protein product [Schistosoma curassoni]|uniref:DUF1738 domain-containing protein n=1 Tax=Schistosoma curassoni TaxID=6186 RepID=A0A183KZG2_9TREM|nr:unnamed protein product [Schistosoma curassoni]